MSFADWGALARSVAAAVAKAVADYRANKARPPAPPMTAAEAHAAIVKLEALAPIAKAWLAANPGALTATDDVLTALEHAGFTWAAAFRVGVDASPDLVAEAVKWLPAVEFAFGGAFAPAPTWQPGPGPYRGR